MRSLCPVPKVPRTFGSLRAFCARHRLTPKSIARFYGCDRSYISHVLNEDLGQSARARERLRAAVRAAYQERRDCQENAE